MIGATFSRRARIIIGAIMICAVIASCSAQTADPVAVHMQANAYEPEHDEVVTQTAVTDYYPNRQAAREVVLHRLSGGMIDADCMDAGCTQASLKISGFKMIPNGSYQFLQSSDSNIIMVRDAEGARILGYLARNDGGGAPRYFPDLKQAQAFEHKGDAVRTAGKVAIGVLLVAALAALVVGAAAAEADSNQSTTRCTTVGESTTCSTY